MSRFIIGVDTGGTYTDVCVIDETGRVTIGKAPTTPKRLDDGVLDALDNAAQARGLSRKELLNSTITFCQGTTIGTNALINRRCAGQRVKPHTGLLLQSRHLFHQHHYRAGVQYPVEPRHRPGGQRRPPVTNLCGPVRDAPGEAHPI